MRSTLVFRLGVFVLSVLSLTASASARDPGLVASTPPLSPEAQLKTFHLPPGFEIELVAAEPMIRKPINMNFDDRNRLWVTESVEYPFPAPPDKKGRDCVKILEDTDGDGKADKVTVFADGLNIPIGVLPIPGVPGSALVYSIPNVVRLTNSTGGDKADKREVFYSTFGFNDTHGMASNFSFGFDGWVYACHGFSNTSEVKGADGKPIVMQSGNTWRMRTDGSHCEYFTHGQVNPFGLCFDALGNLYSADCHSRPIYQLLKGGYYPSFGKPNDGLGFAPEMCDHDHGSTAICGLVLYEADHFPPQYRGTDFIGNVVTNRINHDRIEWHGSSPKAIQQPDFLTCDDPWFRPVDIKLGPDGALYVADFYNRIIGHYEVPLTHPGRDHDHGRIWRIVYRGTDGTAKRPVSPHADFGSATIAELVTDLSHNNLTVRLRSQEQLIHRPKAETVAAVRPVLINPTSAVQRVHALYVLDRLSVLSDGELLTAVRDTDRGVRLHALRILAGLQTLSNDALVAVREALKDADPVVRRGAAVALGGHPTVENIRPLLALREQTPGDDSHLVHAVRIAIRDQLAALGADWSSLPTQLSAADLGVLADVALGVPTSSSAAFLLAHLRPESGDRLDQMVHHVARYQEEGSTPALIAFARANRPEDTRHQASLFKAIQQGRQERGAPLPSAARDWAVDLANGMLTATDDGTLVAGVELAGSLRLTEAGARLEALVGSNQRSEGVRKVAVSALMNAAPENSQNVCDTVLGNSAEAIGLREHVANELAKSNRTEGRGVLLKALPTAPARLQTVIAMGLSGSPAGADALLDAVTAGKASARLLQEQGVALRLQAAKSPKIVERVAALTKDLPPADQKLQDLLHRRHEGFGHASKDVRLGAAVFEKTCAGCHQLAGKGAKVGPQLDGVGVRGVDRLLEDIIDPNRNVDQAFRSTTLVLKSDQIVSGLVLREEGEIIVLADAQGKEVRIDKKQVESRTVSQLSPMPANVADTMTEPEFYHLLAYLLSQKPPATTP